MIADKPLMMEPNIRFERAGATSGYVWGKPACNSNILKQLAYGESGVPFWKTSRIAHLSIEEHDCVAERWICSDDREFPSKVKNFDHTLISFHSLIKEYTEKLLGHEHIQQYGPSLQTIMKLLDTNNNSNVGSLSVQVHPGRGSKISTPKTEMWKGEGNVYLGWRNSINPLYIRDAIATETLEHCLNKVTLKKDHTVIVPGGVVHAIRYGTFLSEWSRAPDPCETGKEHYLSQWTYSLYDRTDGRKPRPGKENLDDALAILNEANEFSASTHHLDKATVISRDNFGNQKRFLFQTPEVFVEEWEITTAVDFHRIRRGFPLFIERGSITLVFASGMIRLRVGDEVFIPAAINTFRLEICGNEKAIVQKWYAPFSDEIQP